MIKQGVSFYSYQEAYRSGRLDLEGMVAEVAKLGADGIELLPTMTPPTSYPQAKLDEVDAFRELMDKYHTRPVCLDSVIVCDKAIAENMSRMGVRNPYSSIHTDADIEEQAELVKAEITLANQLGFTLMRIPLIYGVKLAAFEKCLSYSEEKNVTLGFEVHVPFTLKGPEVSECLEFIERTGTSHACLIPDMAIFARDLPVRLGSKALDQGADPRTVDRIRTAFRNKEDLNELEAELKAKKEKGIDEMLAFAKRNVTSEPEDLRPIIRYIKHFHSKFYEVDENYIEHGIRFDEVIKILIEERYDGYLDSEFEGQRMWPEGEPCDEIEQVRRQHVMVKRMIESQLLSSTERRQ